MFNKSKIMKRAWEFVKQHPRWKENIARELRYALILAWTEAKNAPRTVAQRIQNEIAYIEAKNFLTAQDYAAIRALRRQLYAGTV